jgi:hypothetical protein
VSSVSLDRTGSEERCQLPVEVEEGVPKDTSFVSCSVGEGVGPGRAEQMHTITVASHSGPGFTSVEEANEGQMPVCGWTCK